MQEQAGVGLVGIHIQVIDPLRIELARATDEAVHFVALVQRQLGQVRAVLAGDAGDEGLLGGHCASAVSALRTPPEWASWTADSRTDSNRSVMGPISNALS